MGLPEDDELDRRMRSADPVGPALAASADVGRLVSELARAAVATGAGSTGGTAGGTGPIGTTPERLDRLARSRRRGPTSRRVPGRPRAWQRVAVAGLAAAALLGTAFASSDGLARTGIFGSPGFTESDTSEWLNTGAPDFREVVESLRPSDIPLPAGRSWQPVIDQQVANGQREPARMQVTGVRQAFAFYAVCVWDGEWLAARQAGDTVRVGRAVEVIRGVPSWPIFVENDGGGTVDWLRSIAEAATHGDEGPVRQNIRANCTSSWIGVGQ